MNTKQVLSTAVLLIIFAVPALAQGPSSFDGKSDQWFQAFELQITRSLESPLESVQSAQLKNVIGVATFYRSRVDMTHVVPSIIEIHRSSDDAALKALAVAALQSIDSMEARRYLRKKIDTNGLEAGRAMMLAVLNAYTSGEPLADL